MLVRRAWEDICENEHQCRLVHIGQSVSTSSRKLRCVFDSAFYPLPRVGPTCKFLFPSHVWLAVYVSAGTSGVWAVLVCFA